ncbi:MAG: PQQ-binding-like beta-propeller repeat protein [Desulfatitalea sp.]|nr:PQQ-binding-like beta-propeller repeat protein [Desulfatitalea sp.]
MIALKGRWPEPLKEIVLAGMLLCMACLLVVPPAAAVDISDVPLDTQISAPAPLVMFVWDDSDSMDREFMTPEPNGLFSHRYYLFPDESYSPAPDHNDGLHRDLGAAQRPLWRSQWHGYNRIYFNPRRMYAPWPDTARFTFGPADLDRPYSDPMHTASSDARLRLSAEFFSVRSGAETITIPNAHYFTIADDNGNQARDPGEAVYLVTWQDADGDRRLNRSDRPDNDQRRYFRFDDDGDERVEDNELTPVTTGAELDRLRPMVLDAQGREQRPQTDAEALQNFANWCTYHRRRETAAKAVAASAIDDARQCYIGLYTVNGETRLGVRPVHVTGVAETAGPGSTATRLDESEVLINALYRIDSRGQSGLRQALDQVGRYFHQSQTSALGPAPWFPAEQGGACQRGYAVLLSDGFWNGLFSGVGNADGDRGSPYADRWSDTLADVAMQYYRTDLAPGLEDMVPTQGCDTAVHQHMVTHVLSFGLNGTIDRQDIDADGRPDRPGYADDPCFALPDTPHPTWPLPVPEFASTVDDLWHAAVNGRGLYMNADDPEALKTAMDRILEAIGTAVSSSGLAVSGTAMDDASVVYQALYRSDDWSGEVLAFALGAEGTLDNRPENALWRASAQLQPSETLYDQRRILTYGGPWREPQGVPFRYDALSAEQKQLLGAGLANEQEARQLLDYLRGRDFPHLRRRSCLLGDVVHATPVMAGRTLFVGANDGMLHALDSQTGAERFAYVPNRVFDHLAAQASPKYPSRHKFYVDGPPYVGEVLVGPFQRRSYLVGGLGKGGRGCYGLLVESRQREAQGAGYGDYQTLFSVDDIGDGSAEQSLAPIVLWEYPRPETTQDGMDNDGDGLLDEEGEAEEAVG